MIRRVPQTARSVYYTLYGHAYFAMRGGRYESSYQQWRRIERRQGEKPSRLADFGLAG